MKKLTWDEKYNLLIEYLEENNGKYPKSSQLYKGVKIGYWINKLRTVYNNGTAQEDGSIKYNSNKITKEQIDKLNEINFIWKVDISKINQNMWDEKYNILKEYLKENNGKYPIYNVCYKYVFIGIWVFKQRSIYNNGVLQEDGSIVYNGEKLTKKQIDKLNEIGFSWSAWEYKYKLLKEYLDENNGEYPKVIDEYKDIELGDWIKKQRMAYNKGTLQEDGSYRYGTIILTKEKIDKLNEINFKWSGQKDEWGEKFQLLLQYLKENDGKYPKYNEIYKNINIGKWVCYLRTVYSSGKCQNDGSIVYGKRTLTSSRIEQLNKINFAWVNYTKLEYDMELNSKRKEKIIQRIILYKLKKVLEQSKNKIENKDDIKQIEEEFVKSLTIFY